ncbi:MAG: LysM peptidoglycan-binding domain-containing protein [Actinomycetota bacterium]|nr:LysM peptidoglycan-binding domain-containing protein [Actinomycetota bacterium]
MAELEKAFLKFEGKGKEKLPCLFNPETITITKTNDWGSDPMPGKGVPRLEFKGQSSGTMNFDLVFDTTADGRPVTDYTNKLLSQMEIDPNLPGTNENTNNGRPPMVVFHWGQLYSFPAVIRSATVTFDYFSSSGVPLRAKVKLDMTQYMASRAFTKQNPTSGTPEPHRVHRVQPGETLDRISARYYGDSTRWRLLADANGVEDPLSIRPGSLLSVPLLGSG